MHPISGTDDKARAGDAFPKLELTTTSGQLVDQLEHDAQGYLVTQPGTTATNFPGVFAAGDVQDYIYRQAITCPTR